MQTKEARLKAFGRVQGVFFRKNVKAIADSLGLNGWVRNEDDGAVSIVVQGNLGELKDFIERVRESPGACNVEEIEGEVFDVSKKLDGFEIVWDKNIFLDKGKALKNLGKRIFRR